MRLSPFSRATSFLAVSAFIFVFALAACSSDGNESDSGGSVTPVPTLVTIPTADPAADGDSGGDTSVASGEALFAANACTACHSTGANTIIGPGLEGVGERAATRVSGLTADEYLTESIRNPGEFLVEGFANLMPTSFADLPESEITDLIAFLKSL